MSAAGLAGGAVGCLIAWAAAAQPLTCDEFRDRLNGNIIVADAEAPEAPVFRESGPSSGETARVPWRTSSLDGTLTCGPGQEFREFYVTLAVTSRERFVAQLRRFVAMNGAAICATSEATLPACTDTGKLLLQSSLEQMGSAFKKKLNNPNGVASRQLQPELRADLTAAPTLMTFSLDVGEGAHLDATRPPLPPMPQTADHP
jgi:hypothetical protein